MTKTAVVLVSLLLLLALVVVALMYKKKPKLVDPQSISYSQVDITEHFGDNERVKLEDWINTVAINVSEKNPEAVGLPPLGANADEVYEVAALLSKLREQIPIPGDGVYCPICHVANIDIRKLHTPCPKCGRELLKFGWD